MSIPVVESKGATYILTWVEEQLSATVSRIVSHTDRTTCELVFQTKASGYHPHLFRTTFNLTSQSRGKNDLSKQLVNKYDLIDEDGAHEIVEQLCEMVLRAYRTGEPVLEIWSHEKPVPVNFMLDPLFIKDKPNMIFGDGLSLKSHLAFLAAMSCQLPWTDNPLGWKPRKANPIIFDWENEEEDAQRIITGLKNGIGIEVDFMVNWRRCKIPLPEDMEHLINAIEGAHADFVIIDSVAVACAGDLISTEVVTTFFSHLRKLKITYLLVSHVAKGASGDKITPYGNVFFHNLVRQEWFAKRSEASHGNIVDVVLSNTKYNLTAKHDPVAYRFTFAGDKIIPELLSMEEMSLTDESIPTRHRILNYLKEATSKGFSCKEIGHAIDVSPNIVKSRLNEMKGSKVVKLSDSHWGLRSDYEE